MQEARGKQESNTPVPPEPPMRRWPHPVRGIRPELEEGSLVHYLLCTLSYQNEMLSEIKTLLLELTAGEGGDPGVK